MLNLLTKKKAPEAVKSSSSRSLPQVVASHPSVAAAEAADYPQAQGKAMKFRYGHGDQPLPGFTVKRGVGIGGFGEVYFATNKAGKEVALKQIQRNLEVEIRGVRQCLNLKHPNLIGLYDIQFDADEQGWIVMEYVGGQSLRDALEAHPHGLPPRQLEHWFSQIVAGVAYLHDHGIVHRDLKPANIFEDQGIVKIGDYGLSKFISCSRRGGQTESVGTFHYMAPEIGRGEYGKEIDVYALGVMLYEMATGVVPFDGESSQEIIMKHLTADPDLSLVDSPLREVIARALAKNPTARTQNVREMLRPWGCEVDERYLLVSRGWSTPPIMNGAQEPPCVYPQQAPVERGSRDNPRQSPAGQFAPAGQTTNPYTSVSYQEPIACKVGEGWLTLNRWWAGLALNSGARTALLVAAVLFLVFNAEILVPLLVTGLLLYVPYYAVWWTVRSPAPSARQRARCSTPQQRQAAYASTQATPPPAAATYQRPVPAPRPASPERPLSVKQWRVARRRQLSHVSRRRLLSEVTGSWLGATAVIAVFSFLAALFQIGLGQAAQPLLMGTVWTALVTLTVAWTAIGFGKRWQGEEGDWAIRAFMQLTSGFAIGAVAFALAEYLMIPWETISHEQMRDIPARRWSGFFGPEGKPLLPAYLAYFPLLMGMVGWWKQVDPLRRTRLSFWPVIWAALAASLVHLVIPFPQPWGALIAVGASLAIQLASPWINPTERLQPAVNS